MQLKAVGGVAVGDLGFQVGGQVDDVNGTERTLLGTDTTTDAKTFRDEGDLGLGGDLDTELAGTDHRARLLTFLATFLKRQKEISILTHTDDLGYVIPLVCTVDLKISM